MPVATDCSNSEVVDSRKGLNDGLHNQKQAELDQLKPSSYLAQQAEVSPSLELTDLKLPFQHPTSTFLPPKSFWILSNASVNPFSVASDAKALTSPPCFVSSSTNGSRLDSERDMMASECVGRNDRASERPSPGPTP